MKIKRFVARSMRQALQDVRKEQGPDAVILSNKRVDGGIEVVAAVDYDATLMGHPNGEPNASARSDYADEQLMEQSHSQSFADNHDSPLHSNYQEADAAAPVAQQRRETDTDDVAPATTPVTPPRATQDDPALAALRQELRGMRGLLEDQLSSLAWNDEARRDPATAHILRRFAELGLDADVARNVAANNRSRYDATTTIDDASALLADSVSEVEDCLLEHGGIVAVVGPTGVGKTTSIAKLAARYALRHGRDEVALVSTDCFRIGAQEQLATFAQILEVPVHMVTSNDDITGVLRSLEHKKLVLIDTAGMSQRDQGLAQHLNAFESNTIPIRKYLALAANAQAQTLDEVIREFGRIKLDGCILTKFDEAGSLGAALSALIRHRLPLAYMADGQRVPEDLHAAAGKTGWMLNVAKRLCESHGAPGEEYMARNYAEVRRNAYA